MFVWLIIVANYATTRSSDNSGINMDEIMGSRLFIGLGANLTPDGYASPREGCIAAVSALADEGVHLSALSRWYESAPVPISNQPWYLNAVAEATTELDAPSALAALHQIERRFGRIRAERNAARVLDLDLLDFAGTVRGSSDLALPHPRLHKRAFVLLPLGELCPDWVHPVSGIAIQDLIAMIPADQKIRLAG
ncbi:2-amino-4-hydroxy-6-hydroxymethyldihydropteridine diphosphokinase [Alphaproteobacteria bacterium]|nr:2-amino-4-hydroxy-6-hydroxymethyldihydropteridine diphosphokinase [Alphaproteobacteria bacterium]